MKQRLSSVLGYPDRYATTLHMMLDQYTLAVDDSDWDAIAPEWDWIVPSDSSPILMTRFGDVFLTGTSDVVHLLDLENGTCDLYSDDRHLLLDTIAADKGCNELLLMPLVDRVVANDMTLPSGSCYHYKIPTVLGGDFTADNLAVIDVPQRIRFCGDFHRQIKDLPDGSPIKLKIVA